VEVVTGIVGLLALKKGCRATLKKGHMWALTWIKSHRHPVVCGGKSLWAMIVACYSWESRQQ